MKIKYKAVLRTKDHDPKKCEWVLVGALPHCPHPLFYILPATPEAYDAQVEAMAKACSVTRGEWKSWSGQVHENIREEYRRGLAAIGIKRPSAKEGEKTL